MIRLVPKSLFGQTVAVILLGLAVSQAVGAYIYNGDRDETVRSVGGLAAARRTANLVRLLEDSPPDSRARMAEMVSEPGYRVSVSARPPDLRPRGAQAEQAIRDYLAEDLSLSPSTEVVVALPGIRKGEHCPTHAGRHGRGRAGNGGDDGAGDDDDDEVSSGQATAVPGSGRGMGLRHGMRHGGHGPMARTPETTEALSISVHLSDGRWLAVSTGIPEADRPSWRFGLTLAVMALVVFAASAIAVRRVVRPLGLLASAADRFGRDTATAPLPETGPAEVRRAVSAFNRMGDSLRRLIDGRSRLLAAVSHDLRTPLTLLRLRAEDCADGENRDRMLATIADMEALVGAALEFARGTQSGEERRPTDLRALLESIVDDMADTGLPVSLDASVAGASGPMVAVVQMHALKRAFTNLIGNAVAYGGCARIATTATPGGIRVDVDDDGPGIAETDLERVFDPFVRLDESRNADTGGSGLGLPIARSIVEAHGGQVTLFNRPGGGLRARVDIPL